MGTHYINTHCWTGDSGAGGSDVKEDSDHLYNFIATTLPYL